MEIIKTLGTIVAFFLFEVLAIAAGAIAVALVYEKVERGAAGVAALLATIAAAAAFVIAPFIMAIYYI